MSDCDFCIGDGDSDYGPEFFTQDWVKARKPHRCCECRRTIEPGERYERYSGKWDGVMNTYKTCEVCQETRETFACNGFIFGQLWDDMDEAIQHLTTGCLSRLVTAKAKASLVERWRTWKFSDENRDRFLAKRRAAHRRAGQDLRGQPQVVANP